MLVASISDLKKKYSNFHLFRDHILKGFDRQTQWFVNFIHFPLKDFFRISHVSRY